MKSVDTHKFAMVPQQDIPRSKFRMESAHKTTFDGGFLVPVYLDEVLPGDTFSVKASFMCRFSTPIFPVMDNAYLDVFWFYVPMRLTWSHWVNFMGEQDNPTDTIAYSIPQVVSPVAGFVANSLQDYFGLPTVGQIGGAATVSVNTLPLRAYNLIWNQWFRDENLQTSAAFSNGDGPDSVYPLLRRGKRHDYFTACLPWPQKGGVAVQLPLGGTALVKTSATATYTGNNSGMLMRTSSGNLPVGQLAAGYDSVGALGYGVGAFTATGQVYPSNLYADLTTATGATINALRTSITIQQLLEKDARGGTRYTEIVRSHFGVASPDARLQRPEFLGSGTYPVNINPVSQTSATGVTGGATPLGTLSAVGTVHGQGGFTQSFVEHGYILCLASVRADLSYQQGLRKLWSRLTRYDFYFPVFAALGEQAVLNQEIYMVGTPAQDTAVFGYQERWAEYRYHPSMITGLFRSTYATPLDAWHYAQKFGGLPTLNSAFIADTPPFSRNIAVGAAANGSQFIMDSLFVVDATRAMPLYGIPGLTRI